MRSPMASQDRHRRRNSARNASLTASKVPPDLDPWCQCYPAGTRRQGGQYVGADRASTPTRRGSSLPIGFLLPIELGEHLTDDLRGLVGREGIAAFSVGHLGREVLDRVHTP